MAHHSRYKRIAADRIPLLDEKVFNRKMANLMNRFAESDMTAEEYMEEYVVIAKDFPHYVYPNGLRPSDVC